jgi:transposase
MGKDNFFSGQPVFSQLLHLLPRKIIRDCSLEQRSDRYYKKFDTQHHLITMLYACYQHCTSLREVITGMYASQGRLQPLGIKSLPARSTLSEANKNRSYQVFEQIFFRLLHHYRHVLPDSRSKDTYFNRLIIVDSTTITLFKEILKGAGTRDKNGKRKGGIKVHMAVQAREDLPYLIKLTSAATPDKAFVKHLSPPKHSIIVMDKGYNSFDHYIRWKASEVDWVTRLNKATVYSIDQRLPVNEQDKQAGLISDSLITMGHSQKANKVRCRLVRYIDPVGKKTFEFITSATDWPALRVAAIYKQRWQIELLFKRLKQNLPLRDFLGDNENAVRIQIFCALISDLLLKIIQKKVKRKWSYSNMAALVRMHLVNYTDLIKFMENPDKCRIFNPIPVITTQLSLFARYG